MYGFNHRPHPIQSIMIVHYPLQCRLHLYNGLRRCLIWFTSQTTLSQTGPESLVSVSEWTRLIWSVILLSCLVFSIDLDSIGHDSLVLFWAYTTPVWSVMSLLCLIFVTNNTLFDRSWQFSFDFGINHTYTIDHIIVLSSFCHRLHPFQSTTKAQFHFQLRSHLYNWSRHCSIWFSHRLHPIWLVTIV